MMDHVVHWSDPCQLCDVLTALIPYIVTHASKERNSTEKTCDLFCLFHVYLICNFVGFVLGHVKL